ncbi:MAG: vWA domain-containing protein [Vicinamibacterales bacterium]
MSFASPLPTWLLVAAVGGVGALAYLAYAKTSQALSPTARWFLRSLRAASLLTLLILVMRPVRITPSLDFSRAVVPILIDQSASMALPVASGGTRIDRAVDAVRSLLDAKLGDRFSVEVLGYEDRVAPLELDRVEATGRRSDLKRALQIVRERYRDRQVAGIVLLTDGADTSPGDMHVEAGPPVFTIGFGDARIAKDREVVDVTVGQPSIGGAVVDLSATIVSHGFGHEPFDVRVFEGERLLQVRKVTAAGDGAPVREVFRVSPKADAPTAYAVEVVADHAELTDANNRQSVLVQPAVVECSSSKRWTGIEHSFLKRALATDPHMEVDSVVRKGRTNRTRTFPDPGGEQPHGRALARLSNRAGVALLMRWACSPTSRAISSAATSSPETAAFVAERGGGLLVMGGQSFERGVSGRRRSRRCCRWAPRSVECARAAADGPVFGNRVALTTEGERHPVMRLGASPEDSLKSWAEMPALAASVSLGAARPGAAVLAVTSGPGGASRPLLAVQPCGRGRSMVFTGEGAWRWRMMLPSADKTYEAFWRQAVRWLTMDAPDPIGVRMPPLDVGEAGEILVDVRNPPL